jgi:hypothetical protein
MTGFPPPDDGEAGRTRFIDALTGLPLPAEPSPPAEPPAPPEPPHRQAPDKTMRVVLALAGVVVLVIFVGVVTMIGHFNDLAESRSSTSVDLTSTVHVEPPIAPVITGWQPVVSDDHPFAFDVPGNWHVESPETTVGFQEQNGKLLLLHGVGRFKNNFCPGLDVSSRAQAGFTTIDADEVSDAPDAARETMTRWAEAAYGSADGSVQPQVDVTAAQSVEVFSDTVEASQVTATVRPVEAAPCGPPSVTITAVALPLRVDPSAGQYHVHVMLADQEVDDAVAPEVMNEIIGSIRQAD